MAALPITHSFLSCHSRTEASPRPPPLPLQERARGCPIHGRWPTHKTEDPTTSTGTRTRPLGHPLRPLLRTSRPLPHTWALLQVHPLQGSGTRSWPRNSSRISSSCSKEPLITLSSTPKCTPHFKTERLGWLAAGARNAPRTKAPRVTLVLCVVTCGVETALPPYSLHGRFPVEQESP